MPTAGTPARRVRGISDEDWADFDKLCRELYGIDRSERIRWLIANDLAEYRNRKGASVTWTCEGNTFERTCETSEDARARAAELAEDATVTDVQVTAPTS